MRKALIVGIDYYKNISSLRGAVKDANGVKKILERNADRSVNFDRPNLMESTGPDKLVTRAQLRNAVTELFSSDLEIALFYFSGHGYIDSVGGYLCTSDCEDGHDGLSLAEVMNCTYTSPAKNKIIILDSCYSGDAGSNPVATKVSEISEGTTILAASTANQPSIEIDGAGVFTTLLIDALNGAAANLVGDITPGSVYAHIDQSLGSWDQSPVFKTNVAHFVSLRKAAAPIELADLQKLTVLFPDPAEPLPLDPSYEPLRSGTEDQSIPSPDPKKNQDFAVLQNLVKVNLVRPVGAPHMWHAAMQSKSCELTFLGRHYWNLVHKGLI